MRRTHMTPFSDEEIEAEWDGQMAGQGESQGSVACLHPNMYAMGACYIPTPQASSSEGVSEPTITCKYANLVT